jgi:hypothetical protein
MDLRQWSRSNTNYGRRLFDSSVEGARSGQDAFLKGKPLTPFVSESVRSALKPAAVGVCIGLLGGSPWCRQTSSRKALTYGLLCGALGLCAGLLWESRLFAASVAGGALGNIGRVRDERWLARHPIDYA